MAQAIECGKISKKGKVNMNEIGTALCRRGDWCSILEGCSGCKKVQQQQKHRQFNYLTLFWP